MIYALLAVNAVGLGAPAGALAIAVGSFVSLGKLYAEALESVSPGPVEAVRAVGGSPLQVFVYGMMPQVLPLYLSTTLYTLEYNIKDSFIVGIVGAGGLGYELLNNIRLFKWLDTGVIVALLILLVNLVDYALVPRPPRLLVSNTYERATGTDFWTRSIPRKWIYLLCPAVVSWRGAVVLLGPHGLVLHS